MSKLFKFLTKISVKMLINDYRLFSISYKTMPTNLKNQLELFCDTKMKEFNKLSNIIDFNNPKEGLIEEYNLMRPLMGVLSDIEQVKMDTEDLHNLFRDSQDESDILDIMEIEKQERLTLKENLYNKLIKIITSSNELDSISEVSFEILCGAGGQESMLFAEELSVAYMKYVAKKNWVIEKESSNESELGGVRSCKYIISGEGVYSNLKYESGIHRVQRIPLTSPLGKIHTSTVAVIVLPSVEEFNIDVPEKHLKWDFFKASGPGGQHVNTTDSAVRVIHIPSGLSITCQSGRLQQSNKKEALNQLLKLLNEKQFEEKLQKHNSNRRILIGSKARSDKIRTYNFQQDRITDHRIHRSWSNLLQILNQGDFEEITSSLREVDLLDQLELVLNKVDSDKLL